MSAGLPRTEDAFDCPLHPAYGRSARESYEILTREMNTSPTDKTPTKAFAILIKAPNIARSFVPREGETITITDKDGKELWAFKNPQGQGNPGITIYDVQIDLLTEREFGNFAQRILTANLRMKADRTGGRERVIRTFAARRLRVAINNCNPVRLGDGMPS